LFFSVAIELSFRFCFFVELQQPTPQLPGKVENAGGAQGLPSPGVPKPAAHWWFRLASRVSLMNVFGFAQEI
jgi:hypothetical protein